MVSWKSQVEPYRKRILSFLSRVGFILSTILDGDLFCRTSSELSIRSDDGPKVDSLFAAERTSKRINGALVVSVASHISIYLVGLFIAGYLARNRVTPLLPDLRHFDIVWVPMAGPGGGGGGGSGDLLGTHSG